MKKQCNVGKYHSKYLQELFDFERKNNQNSFVTKLDDTGKMNILKYFSRQFKHLFEI